ncbi:MAG: glycosyltransferase family 2 protein [Chloroflexota bacterium]|nr:MAG: glycosyltransferase family 2 protein [Chloroflexota bacterium]
MPEDTVPAGGGAGTEFGRAAHRSAEDPGIETPPRWRMIAASVLVGGVAAGFVAAADTVAVWIVGIFAAVLVVGLIPILVGSRRPPLTLGPADPPAGPLPTILVLIAGRNEATVLPSLIADLAAQDHRNPDGSARFSIVIVDDRSTDGTGAAVMAAARAQGIADLVTVLRRDEAGAVDGKGAALASARPEASELDVVAVLDADARVGPAYLSTAARYVAAGLPALTARRRTLQAERSALSLIQADEQTQDGEIQRGRWASGGCSEFRGNGIIIRTYVLSAIGGIPTASLTEDLDLSTRLAAARGITVGWALELEAWEAPVPAWRGLWRQRLRWSEGAIRRFLAFTPSVLRSARLPFRARWDFAAYGAQLAAPPLILGAIGGALAFRNPGFPGALIGSYLLAGGVLAFDALRWETQPSGAPLSVPERLARSVRVALFSFIWLIAVNGALWRLATRRGPARFDKTARTAAPGPAPAEIAEIAEMASIAEHAPVREPNPR